MMRTVFLSLLLSVSLSSSSLLGKSLSRRQAEPQSCQAIEGFECKCSYYRVTCTSDRDVPQSITVLPNEAGKYQSVELVLNGEREQNVNEHTFEPVKSLYKPDADNLEFRIKFEKFSALHLSSPGLFNRVFPDNLPADARKHMALEIYNPLIQPHDNINLFQNLNADSLELYVLYPFRGTFQQLFNGANIKYLRLSGGDITSDLSQPFSGNIGRLELAKQAATLSVENFPVYPAHELIINAFYVTDFSSEHPPNYANLRELRVYSPESIPANAFRQFPNIHTLSVSSEKGIDANALAGLNNLEKLTIKDSRPSLELLNSIPNVKEFEVSIEKLDERSQCQLIEKLANGQVAIQAIPNGPECTCVSAYLDSASGRYPCDAQNCDQSSCATIKNNYDAATRTFKAPPAIRRSDGTDALRPREARVYTAPFQVPRNDQEKLEQGVPQPAQPPSAYGDEAQQQQQQQQYDQQQQQYDQQQQQGQQQPDSATSGGQSKKGRTRRPGSRSTTPVYEQSQQGAGQEPWLPGQPYDPSQQQPDHQYHPDPNAPQGETNQEGGARDDADQDTAPVAGENQQGGEDADNRPDGETNAERPDGDNAENRPEGQGTDHQHGGASGHEHQHVTSDANQVTEAVIVDGAETSVPAKKGMDWWKIIAIAAAVVGLILAILLFCCLRKRRAARGYNPAATNEHGGASGARA